MEDETASWFFFHFCACVGCTKDAPSPIVLKHVAALKDAIRAASEDATRELRRAIPWVAPDKILDEWSTTLEMMEKEANRNAVCTWSGHLDDHLDNSEQLARIRKFFDLQED